MHIIKWNGAIDLTTHREHTRTERARAHTHTFTVHTDTHADTQLTEIHTQDKLVVHSPQLFLVHEHSML